MTEEFRKQREKWLVDRYDELIRQRKQPDAAMDAVHKMQLPRFGLSFLWVKRIVRGYTRHHIHRREAV